MVIIVLWILLAIIAVIVILLHFSVRVYLKYDGDFEMNIKYMFFNIYPRKPKKEKNKRERHKKSNKDKNSQCETADKIDFKIEETESEFEDNIDDDFLNVELSEAVQDKNAYNSEMSQSDDYISNVQSQNSKNEYEAHKEVKTVAENKKQKRNKKKTSKSKHSKRQKAESTEQAEESTLAKLKKRYLQIKPYLPMGWKYFKKLLKTVRITSIDVEIDVGREDAHEAAIYYGTVQGILFNLLGILANAFTVKIKKANVNCDFTKNTIDGQGECYVKVRPSALIAILFCIAVNFGFVFLKQKLKNKHSKKKISDDEEIKIENNLEV